MKKFFVYCLWATIIAGLAAALPDPVKAKAPKQFLKLWINPSTQGLAQLYWQKEGQIIEANSEKSTIYDKNKFISLKFMLPVHYEKLRFDPFPSAGSFKLKDVSIVDVNDKLIRKIDIGKVTPAHQIKSFQLENGIIKAETAANANDPILLVNDSYTFLPPPWHVRYRTSIFTFFITFAVVIILGYLADMSDAAYEEEAKEQQV